jgi:hypothetical protein
MAKQAAALSPEERTRLFPGEVVTVEKHPLSPVNRTIAIMQRPSVSIVGGFRQWQAVGRIVRKGEKSLAIWCPIAAKVADETGEAGDNPRPGFRLVSVFDIAQTDEITAEE